MTWWAKAPSCFLLKKKGDTLDVLGPLGTPFKWMPPEDGQTGGIDRRWHWHCADAYPFRCAQKEEI